MVLVDTSIWVDHLRNGNDGLRALLKNGKVLCHPFVVGELACGSLAKRSDILTLLQSLPSAKSASNEEVLSFIERRALFGRGIGLIDVHLLASAKLMDAKLWTRDRRLSTVADRLGVAYRNSPKLS